MPIRNSHRLGDWLMVDEESGHIVLRSQCLKIWNGTYRRAKSFETRQPQEFVKARNDPRALREVRPDDTLPQGCPVQFVFVGNTSVRTTTGAATHLFDPGIDDMEISCTFQVR